MGWGIDFTKTISIGKRIFSADVFLNRQDYGENPFVVQDAIDAIEDNVRREEERLLMYASSDPLSVVPEKEDEPVFWLQLRVRESIDMLREYYVKLYELRLYKEYLETNGKET